MLKVLPVTLHGQTVRLEPLAPSHAPGIAANADPELFKFFMAVTPSEQSEAAARQYIAEMQALPNVLPFAAVLQSTGEAVGSTSYMDIRAEHRSLEIGMSWYGYAHQGTKVNPECKLLLLEHAFERLGCVRVQLKTDARNIQSQRGIEKLGAVKEGVLRKHGIMPNGFVRATVMYSITDDEWPRVKRGLLERLNYTTRIAQ